MSINLKNQPEQHLNNLTPYLPELGEQGEEPNLNEKFLPSIEALNQNSNSLQNQNSNQVLIKSHHLEKYLSFSAPFQDQQEIIQMHQNCQICRNTIFPAGLKINLWTSLLLRHKYFQLFNEGIFIEKDLFLNQIYKLYRHLFTLKLFSYFTFQLHILNIPDPFKVFKNQFKSISSGSYGTVYRMIDKAYENIVFKLVELTNQKKSSKNSKKTSFYDNQAVERILVQYCIYKLLSVMQLGLKIESKIGFDLIFFQDSILFQMEEGIPCTNLSFQILNEVEPIFQKTLAQSLYFLHSLQIVHRDIKPQNMLYSPSFKKIVMIDFGISQVIKEEIGYLTQTRFVGNLQFCIEDLREIFYTNESKHIDLYWNDAHSLIESIKAIKPEMSFQIKYGIKQKQKEYENTARKRSKVAKIQFVPLLVKQNKRQYNSDSSKQSVRLIQDEYELIKTIRLIHGIYKENKEKVEDTLDIMQTYQLSSEAINFIFTFMKDLPPTIKRFDIFHHSLKHIFFNSLNSKMTPQIKQVFSAYEHIRQISTHRFSYSLQVEDKNLARFDFYNQSKPAYCKKIPIQIFTNLFTTQEISRFQYFQHFLSFLEVIDFYDQSLYCQISKDLTKQLIYDMIFHFGYQAFRLEGKQVNTPLNVLQQSLHRIWTQTKDYLDKFCQYKDQLDKQSCLKQQNGKISFFFQPEEYENKRYEFFRQKYKDSGMNIYTLDFILNSIPQIMYRVIKILQRLEFYFQCRQYLQVYLLYANSKKHLIICYFQYIKYTYLFSDYERFLNFIEDIKLLLKIKKRIIDKSHFQDCQKSTKKVQTQIQGEILQEKIVILQISQKAYQIFTKLIIKEFILDYSQVSQSEMNFFQIMAFIMKDIYGKFAQELKNRLLISPSQINEQAKCNIQTIVFIFMNYLTSQNCQIQSYLKKYLLVSMAVVIVDICTLLEVRQYFMYFLDYFGCRQNNLQMDIKRQYFFTYATLNQERKNLQISKKLLSKVREYNIFGMKFNGAFSQTKLSQLGKAQTSQIQGQQPVDGNSRNQQNCCIGLSSIIKKLNPNLKRYSQDPEALSIDLFKIFDPSYMNVYETKQESKEQLKIANKKILIIRLLQKILQLKSYKDLSFFIKVIIFAVKKLNEETHELDEIKFLQFTKLIEKHYVQQSSQKLYILRSRIKLNNCTAQETDQLLRTFKQILREFQQKVNQIDRILSHSQVKDYPQYYWIVKSDLLGYKVNRYYKLLYLDQLLINEGYDHSISKILTQNYRINFIKFSEGNYYFISISQNELFEPVEIRFIKEKLNTNSLHVNIILYESWLKLLRAINLQVQKELKTCASKNQQAIKSPTKMNFQFEEFLQEISKSINIRSKDVYYRYLSFYNYIEKNSFKQYYLHRKFTESHSKMFECFLIHEKYELIYNHCYYFLKRMSILKFLGNKYNTFSFFNIIKENFQSRLKKENVDSQIQTLKKKNIVGFVLFLIEKKNVETFIKKQQIRSTPQIKKFYPKDDILAKYVINDANLSKIHAYEVVTRQKQGSSICLEDLMFELRLSLDALMILPKQDERTILINKFFLFRVKEFKKSIVSDRFMNRKYVRMIRIIKQSDILERELDKDLNHDGKVMYTIERTCMAYKYDFRRKERINKLIEMKKLQGWREWRSQNDKGKEQTDRNRKGVLEMLKRIKLSEQCRQFFEKNFNVKKIHQYFREKQKRLHLTEDIARCKLDKKVMAKFRNLI